MIYFNLLGSDFKISDGSESSVNVSGFLRYLRAPIKLQAKNDNNTGEIESFVLEVTSIEAIDVETGETVEVFAGNPLTVDIIDDDSKCYSIFPIVLKVCFLVVFFSN